MSINQKTTHHMADQIKCPNCGMNIPLTQALSSQIRESVRREYEQKAIARESEVKRREEELSRKAREIDESKRLLEEEVGKRLAFERARLKEESLKKAREDFALELKDVKEESLAKDRAIEELRRNELELRGRARALEEKEKSMELELARRLDAERESIRRSTLEIFSEEHRLKDFEKDKKIEDLRKTIEELKRKAEQGSVQSQGEALELDLESVLKARFPFDDIEPVAKGVRGADIVQKVCGRAGVYSGTIVWESKRTKAWNDEWITKLKDDQREMKADLAVLVTETLPKGVSSFSLVDGVWVSSIPVAAGVAEALRAGLIQVAQARLSTVGKNEKMEAIYSYLTGPEFRQKIEAIVEAFKGMRGDLEKEKAAMTRIWAKREKQIERVLTNTLRLYGDMQGIAGASLPELKSMELGPGDPDEET